MIENGSFRRLLSLIFAATGTAAFVAPTLDAAPIVLTPIDDAAAGDLSVSGAHNGTGDITGESLFVGSDANDQFQRTVVIFQLPALGAGESIEKAEFRIVLNQIQGTPAGDASLVHLRDENDPTVAPADYQATPADTVTTSLVTPASTTGYTAWIDVTDRVQADYTNDPSANRIATFRIQIDDLTTNGDVANRYFFRGMINANVNLAPELRLTVQVPEPAGQMIVGLGGLLGFAGRRRR